MTTSTPSPPNLIHSTRPLCQNKGCAFNHTFCRDCLQGFGWMGWEWRRAPLLRVCFLMFSANAARIQGMCSARSSKAESRSVRDAQSASAHSLTTSAHAPSPPPAPLPSPPPAPCQERDVSLRGRGVAEAQARGHQEVRGRRVEGGVCVCVRERERE